MSSPNHAIEDPAYSYHEVVQADHRRGWHLLAAECEQLAGEGGGALAEYRISSAYSRASLPSADSTRSMRP